MRLTTYRYTIAANESVKIHGKARFFRGMASDADYLVRIDDQAPTKFQTGIAFTSPQEFESLEVINNQAATQTIELLVADGPVDDNRLVGQVDISGGIRLAGNRSADYGAANVSTSAVQIAAANSARGQILLQNLGTDAVYVGPDGAVTAATGIEVSAGGSVNLTLQTAVYAVAGMGPQDVRYIEESL